MWRFTGVRAGQLLLADAEGRERGIPFAQLTDHSAIATPRSGGWHLALSDAPRRDALVVTTSEGERVIEDDRIATLLVGRRTTARWVGTLTGMTVDVLGVILLTHVPSSHPNGFRTDTPIP